MRAIQEGYTPRNLTVRPWKIMGKEDEFTFGIPYYLGAMLNFRGVYT